MIDRCHDTFQFTTAFIPLNTALKMLCSKNSSFWGDEPDSGQALDAVASNGRIRVFHQARLTEKKKGPYTLVLCKAAKMKEA